MIDPIAPEIKTTVPTIERTKPILNTIEIKVRYGETDAMAIAHHGSYLGWLEAGRVELMRQMGQSYKEMEKNGVNLPVIEARLRYLKPARFEDTLSIETSCISLTKTRVIFGYNLLKKDELLAHGYTVHAALGPKNKPIRIPDKLHKLLTNILIPQNKTNNLRWAFNE